MAGVLRTTRPRTLPWLRPRLALVTASLALAAVLGACSEDLEGGRACATLCPGTELESREVTLFPVIQENVVRGALENGTEFELPLIDRKDTIQTRAIVRFDTLLTQYVDSVTDTLTKIDTLAQASVILTVDTARSTIQDSIVVQAYDIDDGSEDTTAAGIESRIVPSRLVGTVRMGKVDFGFLGSDTISVPIDVPHLLAILRRTDESQRRLRLAFRVTSPRSANVRVLATAGSNSGPALRYKHPRSKSFSVMIAHSDMPTGDAAVRAELADFVTVPVLAPRRSDAVIAVGGLPARRTLLRFSIPDSIDLAAAIIEAELRLVQVPDPLRSLTDTVVTDTSTDAVAQRLDTVVVVPLIGIGGESVIGDPLRAGQLARRSIGADLFSVPALRIASSDSGVKSIDVAGLLRRWNLQRDVDPRYLVLAAESEGAQGATAYFWSTAAADPNVRPSLHIRYIPRIGYGLP